jgi:hypothetical protein
MASGISQKKTIVIDNIADTGAAFATTASGEGVFVNKRIVTFMDLQPDEELTAHVVPNYPNMAERIKWRATRVTRTKLHETPTTPIEMDMQVLATIQSSDQDLLDLDDLCDILGTGEQETYGAVARLMKNGYIDRTEAYYVVDNGDGGH